MPWKFNAIERNLGEANAIFTIRSFITFTLLLSACAHRPEPGFQHGSSSVEQFILHEAVARGGTSIRTNDFPLIKGEWRYSRDQNGVIIRLARESYQSVEHFLRLAFGDPKLGPTDTIDGGKLGVYRLSDQGGGIQFGHDGKRTRIIIIKPMSTDEIIRRLLEVMQEDATR